MCRICTPPAPTPSATGAPRGGTTWCAPATRSTGTFRRPAATRPPSCLDVEPALTWKAKLLAVKDLPAGALVGYGGTFRAERPMRIGILGAGYADGIFHRLSNRGKVIADGKLTPILGTVSMDLTTIDLSHTTALAPGDDVTLLGAEGDASIDAQQIARIAGTISYNILCSISARVQTRVRVTAECPRLKMAFELQRNAAPDSTVHAEMQ